MRYLMLAVFLFAPSAYAAPLEEAPEGNYDLVAGRLEDLRIPLGNRLEKLKGDRAGQYSIRVNDQFRICFRWSAAGAEGVEIVDYH